MTRDSAASAVEGNLLPPLEFAPLDLGGCGVTILDAGHLKLDGGAMFGIIPKPLWSRTTPADDRNRIQLRCQALLVEFEGSDRRVVVEVGLGNKYGDKEASIFAVDRTRWIRTTCLERKIDCDSITDVVLTHLHFDHCGGLTYLDDDQQLQATFPKAKVHVQRQELEDARENFGIMTATYREENLAVASERDLWQPLEGATEIMPQVHALPLPGHTRGHQGVLIRGTSRTLCYPADVMPTVYHVGPAFNMGYDLMPLENRTSKARLLERAADEGWLLFLGHDPLTPLVRVSRDGDYFALAAEG